MCRLAIVNPSKARDELKANLEAILSALYLAVGDWREMLIKVDEAIKNLQYARGKYSDEEVDETIDFLKWLRDDHYTFLGFSEYENAPESKIFKN